MAGRRCVPSGLGVWRLQEFLDLINSPRSCADTARDSLVLFVRLCARDGHSASREIESSRPLLHLAVLVSPYASIFPPRTPSCLARPKSNNKTCLGCSFYCRGMVVGMA